MHQKIVVIDEHTVLLGSLNSLSQSRSREVMLTIKGGHFARKILTHEHAEDSRNRRGVDRAGKTVWTCGVEATATGTGDVSTEPARHGRAPGHGKHQCGLGRGANAKPDRDATISDGKMKAHLHRSRASWRALDEIRHCAHGSGAQVSRCRLRP